MARHNRLNSPPYAYVEGGTGIGQGAEIFALVQPGLPIRSGRISEKSVVRKTFQITERAFAPANLQSLPTTDLRANGVYLSGDIHLQALSDFENEAQQ